MGTPGLFGFIIRGRMYGVYNQLDSYPSGLGAVIVKFINSLKEEDYAVMQDRLDNIVWVERNDDPSPEQIEEYTSKSFHLKENRGRMEPLNRNYRVETYDWNTLLYGLNYDGFLPRIFDGSLQHLVDSSHFFNDSLFCDYAYIMDFTKKTLEMYGDDEDEWEFDELRTGYWKEITSVMPVVAGASGDKHDEGILYEKPVSRGDEKAGTLRELLSSMGIGVKGVSTKTMDLLNSSMASGSAKGSNRS